MIKICYLWNICQIPKIEEVIDVDKKDGIKKYMTLYMSLGMCFGVSGGLIFGRFLNSDYMARGMCYGIPIGMCIGMIIGSAKDKRLSKNIMTISRIETTNAPSNIKIYVIDKHGAEKEYIVTDKKMKAEKFSISDRVAEETDGSLVSLES